MTRSFDRVQAWNSCNLNGKSSFRFLCERFPEYEERKYIQKYIQKNLAAAVPELLLVYFHTVFGDCVYWCETATIEDIKFLSAEPEIGVHLCLRRAGKAPHVYLLDGFDRNRGLFSILDTMPVLVNSSIPHRPAKTELTSTELLDRVKGKPIFVSGLLKSDNKKKLVKILGSHRLYMLG